MPYGLLYIVEEDGKSLLYSPYRFQEPKAKVAFGSLLNKGIIKGVHRDGVENSEAAMSRRLIGQCMLEANLISEGQVEQILRHQKTFGDRVLFGKLTISMGFVSEDEFAPFIASYFDVPYVNLEKDFNSNTTN